MRHETQTANGQSKHIVGGAVVVVAILGETKILLIQETTKPKPHYWKLIAETLEPGEPILNALWGGVREEAGLELSVRRLNGQVVEIADGRLKAAKQLLRSQWVQSHFPHHRHFWGLLTTDEVVQTLSGKHLQGDKNEEIDTMAFDLADLEKMVDFHPVHRKLIEQLMSGDAS